MPNAIKNAANKLGGQAALARALNVSPPTVNQWIKGKRPVPVEQCVAIERITGGAVTRRDLRADWQLIWPVDQAFADHAKAAEKHRRDGPSNPPDGKPSNRRGK